ncbi:tetratricopeptide repeat protein [Myxococcota bacterium]|nr:tetratricopeptide repeat protein [Myxococcota bacterium]
MAETSTSNQSGTPSWTERVKKLEKEFKKDPENSVEKLAEAYITGGKTNAAIKVLEKFANGSNPELHVLLAQAHFDKFDTEKATECIKLADKAGNIGNNLRAQVLLGELAFEDSKASDAKKYLKQARKLDPSNHRAAVLLQSLGEDIKLPPQPIDDGPTLFKTDNEGSESMSKAGTQIVLGTVVFAALFGIYYWTSQQSHEAAIRVAQAAPLATNADVPSLKNAEEIYLEALTFKSNNEYAVSGLAEVYTLLWAHHGLAAYKDQGAEYLDRSLNDDLQKAERYSAEILSHYASGRLADAEDAAAAVIERGGVSEKIYWALGLTQRALGKHKLGRANLRRAEELRSGAPHYATALGDAYDEDNDNRNSQLFWNKAAQSNKGYTIGAARALLARVRKGDPATSIQRDIKTLQEQHTRNEAGIKSEVAILLTQGELFLREGKSGEAVAIFNKAAKLGKADARLLEAQSRALIVEKKPVKAMKAAISAKELSKGAERYIYALATTYEKSGKRVKAIKTLEAEKALLSDDPKYHVTLGNYHLAKGELEKAKTSYDAAMKLRDNQPDALLGYAKIEWAKKDFTKATEWLEKGAGERRTFPELYEVLGLMWTEMGAAGDASGQLEIAEKHFLKSGASKVRMSEFYGKVIVALSKARGGSSYAKAWAAKEKAMRESGKK